MKGSIYNSLEFKRRLETFKKLGSGSNLNRNVHDNNNNDIEEIDDLDTFNANGTDSYSIGGCVLEAVDNQKTRAVNSKSNRQTSSFNNYIKGINNVQNQRRESLKLQLKREEAVSSRISNSAYEDETKSSTNKYICEIHNKSYENKDLLRRHLREVHGGMKFETFNPYANANERHFNNASVNRDVRYDNTKYDKTYAGRNNLSGHFNNAYVDESSTANVKEEEKEALEMFIDYDCDKCDETGFSERDLDMHYKIAHGNGMDTFYKEEVKNESLIYPKDEFHIKNENDLKVMNAKNIKKEEQDDLFHQVAWQMNDIPINNYGDQSDIGPGAMNGDNSENAVEGVAQVNQVDTEGDDLDSYIEDLPSKRIGCPNCDMVVNKKSLRRHIVRVHQAHLNEGEHPDEKSKHLRRVICPECGLRICKESLERHQKTRNCVRRLNYNPTQRRTCWVCNRVFTKGQIKRRHVHTVHDKLPLHFKSRNNGYLCLQCGHKSASPKHLDTHVKAVHEKIQNLMCQHCTYKTAYPQHIKQHVRFFHEKIYDYQCDKCTYKARNGQKLKQHVKDVHLKIKDQHCHVCPASFSNKNNLQEHVKNIHEGLRRFHCDVCPYATNRKQAMSMHNLSHTENDNTETTNPPNINHPIPNFDPNLTNAQGWSQ